MIKKKKTEELGKLKTNTSSDDEYIINLYADDDCFERADKMFKIAGLVDRMGMSERFARVIKAYMELDKMELDKK